MQRTALMITILLVSSACAGRTLYKPLGKNGGYSDFVLEDGTSAARFEGNAKTNPQLALLLSKFRAVENCHLFGVTRILGVFDQSSSATIQRSKSHVRNATWLKPVSVETHSWNETYQFPRFDTQYTCEKAVHGFRVLLKTLSSEDAKLVTKDLMPGLQVEKVFADSPNRTILQVGDVLTHVAGARVRSLAEVAQAIHSSTDKNAISVTLIRMGRIFAARLRAVDETKRIAKEQAAIIALACANVSELEENDACNLLDVAASN